jgi:chaperonin GroES
LNLSPLGDHLIVEPKEQDVRIGNVVLYARRSGAEIKIGARKLLIIKESDILAIVEK